MKRWILAGAMMGALLCFAERGEAAQYMQAAGDGSVDQDADVLAGGNQSGAVDIVPWFTPRQLEAVVANARIRARLADAGFRVIAYEGRPDAHAEWVEDNFSPEWLPIHGAMFSTWRTERDSTMANATADPVFADMAVEMTDFLLAWDHWGIKMTRWMALRYPDARDQASSQAVAGSIALASEALARDPASGASPGAPTGRKAMVLVSARQHIHGGPPDGTVWVVDCADADPLDCLARAEAMDADAGRHLRLRPTGRHADDLRRLEHAGNERIAGGGGTILVDGPWILEMLGLIPDLAMAVQDWSRGAEAVIPGGLDAWETQASSRTLYNLMTLGILLVFYVFVRRGSLYGQTLYRFFINRTLLDSESTERDLLNGVMSWLALSGYCLLAGMVVAWHMSKLLPTIGSEGLHVLHPLLFPYTEDPFWSIVAMVASFTFILHLTASIGIWFAFRSFLAFRTVLYALVWPFHLHGIWLLIDPSWLRQALGSMTATWAMAGVFIVSSVLFRFISLLNLSKGAGPKSKGSFMIPFGVYVAGFAVLMLLVWNSSLWQETLPFLMGF